MTEPAVLQGEVVILRPARESDREDRLRCPQDPEFVRMLGGEPEPTEISPQRAQRWLDQRIERGDWVIEVDGRAVGQCGIRERAPRVFNFGIAIWDRSVWGRGVGTEATRLVLRHAFEDREAHRVELLVLEYNARAIRCYEKAGFVVEGRKRANHLQDGHWWDDIMMGILEDEFGRESVAAQLLAARAVPARRADRRGRARGPGVHPCGRRSAFSSPDRALWSPLWTTRIQSRARTP